MGRRGLLIVPVLALVGSLGGPASAVPVVTDTISVGDAPYGVAVSPEGLSGFLCKGLT